MNNWMNIRILVIDGIAIKCFNKTGATSHHHYHANTHTHILKSAKSNRFLFVHRISDVPLVQLTDCNIHLYCSKLVNRTMLSLSERRDLCYIKQTVISELMNWTRKMERERERKRKSLKSFLSTQFNFDEMKWNKREHFLHHSIDLTLRYRGSLNAF